MVDQDKCPAYWLGRHNFKPQFDTTPPPFKGIELPSLSFAEEFSTIMKSLTARKFVGALCKCGRIVEPKDARSVSGRNPSNPHN